MAKDHREDVMGDENKDQIVQGFEWLTEECVLGWSWRNLGNGSPPPTLCPGPFSEAGLS